MKDEDLVYFNVVQYCIMTLLEMMNEYHEVRLDLEESLEGYE